MITILCTVGTSLLGHLAQRKIEEVSGLEVTLENASRIGAGLTALDIDDRRCGAEITSTWSLLRSKDDTHREKLVLFTSDTDDGRLVGAVLKSYFMNQRCKIKFDSVEALAVKDLNDSDRERFKTHGLRALVRMMTESVKKARNLGNDIMINATGGYKAQIAYATLLGQLLKVPVYYQFERFAEIIEMPIMPVAFDLSLYLLNSDLFNEMEDDYISASDPRLIQAPAALEPMFHRENDKVILTALGSLYVESMREQYRKDPMLPPSSGLLPSEKKITRSDGHHRPENLDKLLKHLTSIEQIMSIHLEPGRPTHQDLEFKVAQEVSIIKAHVRDRAGMNPPCTLVLHTTAASTNQQAALRLWLEDQIHQ